MKRVATYLERKQIDEILSKRLHAVEGTDLFRYEEEWNDARVAVEVNPTLSPNAASYVRVAVYGKLQKTRGSTVPSSVKLRVEVLEEQMMKLVNHLFTHDTIEQWEVDSILNRPAEDTL